MLSSDENKIRDIESLKRAIAELVDAAESLNLDFVAARLSDAIDALS